VTPKQIDIFGAGDFSPTKKEKKKAKNKKGGAKKRRGAKKAPMLIDSYDASAGGTAKPPAKTLFEVTARYSAVAVESSRGLTVSSAPQLEKTPPKKIYTVSEITRKIKSLVEEPCREIWISGEVTDFKNQSGKHFYFSLKDEQKNKIRAIIFNAASRKIPFELKDGLELVCRGDIDVYGPGGYYSILIDFCEPKGIGALQLAFEQLKKKLLAEGLFSSERKKRIPFLPKKIGVVTSSTGAAVRDIINVLTRRFPNVEILLKPVKVQGEGSAAEIAEGISTLNERDDIDVMIVGRGGGSIEDLWAFNEEVVARAIAASRIPVISAVGHEIDTTISDMVADVRAATPSAAAEIAIRVKAELIAMLEEKKRQLSFALRQSLERRTQELAKLAQRIPDLRRRFPDMLRATDSLRRSMLIAVERLMERRLQSVAKLASNLDHLSPLAVLGKGYSVVESSDGRIVRSAGSLKCGDSLKIRFVDGFANTRVEKVGR